MSRLPSCILIMGLAAAIAAAQAPVPDCKLVPGWTQQGETRHFVADNLFEYMDGNAEGYVIYDFVSMAGVNCTAGEVTLTFDVSEMASPEAAYGIFQSNRDPKLATQKLGTIAQIQPRRGVFVKDKYYVELAANPEGDHTKVITAFLTAMEKRIPGSSELPALLTWFPADKLDQATLRMIPQSVLGLSLLRRGYLGQYEYGKGFIVTEDSPEAAAGVLKKAMARFKETTTVQVGDEAFQYTDKYLGRLCFFRKGRYVGGFANVTEPADPVAAARALAAKIP
ncbi:MAG: hypothetical protein IT159_00465 [Bryobacterales bacterium]|nr:hypothetical protein [Bryobacterales bacterium]